MMDAGIYEIDKQHMRMLASVAIRDGEAWRDRRLPEMGRALDEALDHIDRLREVLWCYHNESRYVDHDGDTWNYCPECGLFELWANGQLFKQEFREKGWTE